MCAHIYGNIIQPKKMKEILPFVIIWMDVEGIMHTKQVRQRKTNTV